jgi:Rieske Fe-S protein
MIVPGDWQRSSIEPMTEETETATSRRVVLGSAAAIGAGAVLAACGRGTEQPKGTANPTPEPPARGSDGDAGTPAGSASDVPVGSGIISDKAKAVVTQPNGGQFKAFDWTCTHKGCAVNKVEGDTIFCPCHGSQYSVDDGSVKKGPATRGLTELTIVENGGELFIQG